MSADESGWRVLVVQDERARALLCAYAPIRDRGASLHYRTVRIARTD